MSDSKASVIKEGWDHGNSRAFKKMDYYELGPSYEVFSVSRDPPGTADPHSTEVHLHIGDKTDSFRLVMRFKSAHALDTLIDALHAHREDVWGKR